MRVTTYGKHTIAILAFSTLVGCSTHLPVASPTLDEITLRFYSTDTTHTLAIKLTQSYHDLYPNITFDTVSSNHSTLLDTLGNNETPFFVTSQLPDPQSAWAAPIAQQGLAIIVNTQNTLNNVTLEQLRRIYLGNITNWRELGGSDEEIIVFSREEGADTRAEFERLVMGDRRTSPNAQLVTSLEATLSRVSEMPGAIAYLPQNELTDAVKTLMVDNVFPTQQTIADNSYALRSTVYVVGKQEPQDFYRTFISWIQSADGQRVIWGNFVGLPR